MAFKQIATRALALLAAGLCCCASLAFAAGSPLDNPELALLPLFPSASQELAVPTRKSLAGKVIYVDFWAAWCVPCRASFPWMEAMQAKYRRNGFEILALNKDPELADAKKFLAQHPASFTLLADPGDRWATGFGVRAMPSSYLIDRRGNLRYTHAGFRRESATELEVLIRQLVEEAKP